jgi:hypothetical protein
VELPSSPGLGRRRRSLASATASEHHLSPPGSSGSASHADGQTLDGGDLQQQRPAKARKVSRACDFCKSRKAKCSGNQPCSKCVSKGRHCLYNAKYTRGRPPTPPPSVSFLQPDGLMDTAVAPGSSAGTAMSASASAPAAVSTGLAPSRQQHQHQRQHQGDHMLQHNTNISTNIHPSSQDDLEEPASQFGRFSSTHQSSAPSRASPELGMAEIQGQVFDPTSGLTFLHRAWKRLAAQDAHSIPDVAKTTAEIQPVTMAGDRPLPDTDPTKRLQLPSPDETRDLLKLYFDVCIATYRFLYRPAAVRWLGVVERNLAEGLPLHHEIGHARAAIILTALAIATSHNAKSKGFLSAADEARALAQSDELFCVGARLVEGEVGIPKLESAQVRLVQVLYCLTTCRFNKSWYIFGNALSLISTLGLHRLENSKRRRGGVSKTDYIHTQCKRRTFWTAYILDNYLGVMLGRPRHFHDDDIDQELPDPVNDEDMTALGPLQSPGNPDDCHIDALIYHAKYVYHTIMPILGSEN